jgi:hypothetical protein
MESAMPPLSAGLAFGLIAALFAGPATANSNMFCGGAAKGGDPSDLANVVGDQTLEYAVHQPASLVTCAKGYLLVKCGDFETANKVFDKCIAAGYVGSMIWKALMLEDGTGVKPDLAEAARLMQRAATSGDPAYAPLGKLHYATMLHQGKGVPRDEAAARKWFESAAADGNEEAREFLRTGYHTGDRDQSTLGAGKPPPGALVRGLTGENASIPGHRPPTANATVSPKKTANLKFDPAPRPAVEEKTPPPDSSELPAEAIGQRLTAVLPASVSAASPESLWMALLLLLAFATGMLRHGANTPRHGKPS